MRSSRGSADKAAGQEEGLRSKSIATLQSIPTVAFAGGVLLAVTTFYINGTFFHDDAYIILRYVWNLLEGNGVVWNPGEYVQGYTTFLHLLLVSVLGITGLDLVWASRIIGVISYFGLIVFLAFYRTNVKTERNQLWYLPAVIVLTASPVIVWSLGGLETLLFSLLATLGSLVLISEADSPRSQLRLTAISGLLFGLCLLTRPDGIIFIVVSLAWIILREREARRVRLVTFSLPIAVIMVPFIVWQWSYYHSLVPNSFYVKAGESSPETALAGLEYVARYAASPPFLPLFLLGFLIWITARRKWNAVFLYLAASIATYVLFIVYVGGDHMQSYRLMVPLIPLMAYLLVNAFDEVVIVYRPRVHAGLVVAVLLLSAAQLPHLTLNPQRKDRAAQGGSVVGKYINEAWPAGSLVALNTAGSTPYYAPRLRFIDMLGLNDAHISHRDVDTVQLVWQNVPGHRKGDGKYVLSRKPDYIIIGPSIGREVRDHWFLSDLELSHSPEFYRDYELHEVPLGFGGKVLAGGRFPFRYYKRKSTPGLPLSSQ
jgi:arabinofuranosyltransferase